MHSMSILQSDFARNAVWHSLFSIRRRTAFFEHCSNAIHHLNTHRKQFTGQQIGHGSIQYLVGGI